jgi:hypothetical protein
MLEGKAMIEDTDMPTKMQIQAMAYASEALDLYDVIDCKSIAAHIKKVTFFSSIIVLYTQHNIIKLFIYRCIYSNHLFIKKLNN